MAGVILKDVCKVYEGGAMAVKHVDLEIKDREFMVLVGPSGCGKSTTLRMVAGLEEISAGTVAIGEKIVNNVPPKDRDIAMVFQNYALYPHMSVYDNMAFGLKLRKCPKNKIAEQVREAAEILGITDYLKRKPKALSGGQRQRVAVGRAIVRKPEVFLFDEPLSNLDAKMRVSMRTEISKLHNCLKTTMIYVTHDQIEAMTMGDRICVMKDGVIQQVDTPLNIYTNPVNTFVASFIGTPPMNIFRGCLVRENGRIHFQNDNMFLLLPENLKSAAEKCRGEEILLGIRPEDIGSNAAEETADPQYLQAVIDVKEPMGAETYLYLNIATESGNDCIARVVAYCQKRVGDSIRLALDLCKAHLFDASSGKRIS